MDIAIMIEGQNGLNWARWQSMAKAAEEFGFAGLYRSDHFTNAQPPELDSLELWVSLTWLACNTKRIEFGPLVTPASFRDPVFTARMAKEVDDLSGGRLSLGVGAGWQAREHHMFDYDLLEVGPRFDRFAESLNVMTGLLRSDEPVSFAGAYYTLRDAVLLPHPKQPGRPPLLVGGNGLQRTLPLAAQYADEWNGVFLPPEEFARRSARLDELLDAAGRPRESVRRSLMTGLIFGRTDVAVGEKLGGRDGVALRAQGQIVGTPSAVQEQLDRLRAVGVQRVMLQWLELDNVSELEALGKAVL